MMDTEHGIFLQDFLDLVHVFQKIFLPNFETIKQVVEYRGFRRYERPDIAAYKRLVQAIIDDDPIPNGHEVSKAAIYYLDNNLRSLDYLYPPSKTLFQRMLRHPNRIDLEGYNIDLERSQKALMLLQNMLSVNERMELRYDCELIRRNYFAIIRTR